MSDALARALAALDAGRDADAMTALVEAWRARRSPALAELIDLLDARSGTPPYARLVTSRADTSIANLRAVAKHDDPRLATALLGILTSPPFIARTPQFWRLVMTLVEQLADPRIGDRAGELADRLHVRLSPAGLRDEVVNGLRAFAPTVAPPTPKQA